jgi:hypothetical protein
MRYACRTHMTDGQLKTLRALIRHSNAILRYLGA